MSGLKRSGALNPYSLVSNLNTGAHFGKAIAIEGDLLFKVYNDVPPSSQFQSIDITDRTTPNILATATLFANGPTDICVRGTYAYVICYAGANGTDVLHVVDVSDPANPSVVAGDDLSLPKGGYQIVLSGDHLYLGFDTTVATDVLRVIDVSDPLNPTIVAGSGLSLPDRANGLCVRGTRLYMGLENGVPNSFRVLDITNPAAPTILTTVGAGVPSEPRQVVVDGDYAYTGSYFESNGFMVIDVSDPTTPVMVAQLVAPNPVLSIAKYGNFIYLGMDGATVPGDVLRVIDITNPLQPAWVSTASWGIATNVEDIAVDDSYIYVSSRHYGNSLRIYRPPQGSPSRSF